MSIDFEHRTTSHGKPRTGKAGLLRRPARGSISSQKAKPLVERDLVFIVDSNWRVVDYSDRGGILSDAEPGMPFIEYMEHAFPRTFVRSVMDAARRTAQGEQIESAQHTLPTPAGERTFVASCSQLRSSRILVQTRDITERRQAELSVHNRLMLLSSLYEYAQDFPASVDLLVLARHMAKACVGQFLAKQAWVGLVKEPTGLEWLSVWPEEQASALSDADATFDQRRIDQVIKTKEFSIFKAENSAGPVLTGLFPMTSNGKVTGILGVVSQDIDYFTQARSDFLSAYSLLAAAIINHAQLFDDARQRLEQLDTLRRIDQDILSSFDLQSIAHPILRKTVKQLQADAADILILNPETQVLKFVAGVGFKLNTLHYTHLSLGESYAGVAALERRMVRVDNLSEDPRNFSRANNFTDEGFHVYFGMPLISRGEVKGVLEVFQRSPLSPDRKWLRLLETISNQIGIAVDNSLLLEHLDQSNKELAAAYNATIEGLSSALELRDHETDGHTRRVAEMTVRLAEKMGFPAGELEVLRQGALLHDIGKVGIPDAILLKPSALTREEWEIMKQHPLYASKVIGGIDHLKPAIDIPLYHHEKWDGTGYPEGLRKEEIPLQARIFSVIDVYDALTSNRPYRAAWPKTDALSYISKQAGQHFDPHIVDTFLGLAYEFA